MKNIITLITFFEMAISFEIKHSNVQKCAAISEEMEFL